jgi:cation transport ATPase
MRTHHGSVVFQVNEGRIEVDQSALTGESLPVTMRHGDSPKMGSTITRGEVEGTVEVGWDNIFRADFAFSEVVVW